MSPEASQFTENLITSNSNATGADQGPIETNLTPEQRGKIYTWIEEREEDLTRAAKRIFAEFGLKVSKDSVRRFYQARKMAISRINLREQAEAARELIMAGTDVDRLLTRPGRLVTVLSNCQQNGAEFAEKCQAICAEHGAIFEAESRSVELDLLATEIRIKVSGRKGRIKVLAANPRTARGFSGDLILDEFAFHQDDTAIWEAAEPNRIRSRSSTLCEQAFLPCSNQSGSFLSITQHHRLRHFWPRLVDPFIGTGIDRQLDSNPQLPEL